MSEARDLFAFRRNVVLVASAGTGKTHALVGVLVCALLGSGHVRRGRIAATTFSRKAAGEIRERLQTELERLAEGAPSAYQPELASVEPAVLRSRARQTIADLDRVEMGTLHGFAYSIARTHALALGLPPGFGVASEDDTEAWSRDAVEQSLALHATRDTQGVRDLLRLLRGSERAREELQRWVLALEEDGRPAASLGLPESDAAHTEERFERLLAEAVKLRAEPRCAEAAAALLTARMRNDVATMARAAGDLLGTRKQKGDDDWMSLRGEVRGTTNRERGEALVRTWAARAKFVPTAALVRSILAEAQRLLGETQAEAGAVGFGAALRLARDVLRDHPEIAAETASTYDALLVDEFQDTSRVQADIVRLLWERAPASRTAGTMPAWGDLRPRGLLIVGDRKQSIYAFRGADVAVFVSMCIELAGEVARDALAVPPNQVPLPIAPTADFFVLRNNYRARPPLIDFVNAFSHECLRPESDDLSEARYVEATEELLPGRVADDDPAPCALWIRPEGELRDTDRLEDATLIASYVGEALRDTSELAYRDFAVLAQSNEMLDATAFALSRVGIPYVVAGRGFFATREVRDLVLLLRYLERPDDRAALLAVLRGPFVALGDRTLLGLTEQHVGLCTDFDRWADLDRAPLVLDADRSALQRASKALRALRRASERLGPGKTLREAVRELELEQTLLLLPRGIQRIANVRKFLRMADGHGSITSLLERVQRAEDRARETEAATFSEEDDAVRLLTVHASKGLAFPIVILPELHTQPARSSITTIGIDLRSPQAILATKVTDDRGEPMDAPSIHALADKERARNRAERRRLMYVAVTRARDRLVFVGGLKERASANRTTLGSIAFSLASTRLLLVQEVPVTAAPRTLREARPPAPLVVAPSRPILAAELSIAPTALQDFQHCARRFSLVHLLQLPEPARSVQTGGGAAVPGDPRAEGDALHQLLERVDEAAFGADDARSRAERVLATLDAPIDEGARARVLASATRFLTSRYARSIRERGARIHRELAFVLTLPVVSLRGAMDLVVVWPDGEAHVIDYKRARGPDVRPHALQLDIYALAARAELGALRVRAGVVFLGAEEEPEPLFRPPVSSEQLGKRIAHLAEALADARASDRFPRAPSKTCHAIACRYFSLCHPLPIKRQLDLFRG